MKPQVFTLDDLDKTYRYNGPVADRYQGFAFRKLTLDNGQATIVLEPDNSFRRDMWRIDRDGIEDVIKRRVNKTWSWPAKTIKFIWLDEVKQEAPVGGQAVFHKAARLAVSLVMSRRNDGA